MRSAVTGRPSSNCRNHKRLPKSRFLYLRQFRRGRIALCWNPRVRSGHADESRDQTDAPAASTSRAVLFRNHTLWDLNYRTSNSLEPQYTMSLNRCSPESAGIRPRRFCRFFSDRTDVQIRDFSAILARTNPRCPDRRGGHGLSDSSGSTNLVAGPPGQHGRVSRLNVCRDYARRPDEDGWSQRAIPESLNVCDATISRRVRHISCTKRFYSGMSTSRDAVRFWPLFTQVKIPTASRPASDALLLLNGSIRWKSR